MTDAAAVASADLLSIATSSSLFSWKKCREVEVVAGASVSVAMNLVGVGIVDVGVNDYAASKGDRQSHATNAATIMMLGQRPTRYRILSAFGLSPSLLWLEQPPSHFPNTVVSQSLDAWASAHATDSPMCSAEHDEGGSWCSAPYGDLSYDHVKFPGVESPEMRSRGDGWILCTSHTSLVLCRCKCRYTYYVSLLRHNSKHSCPAHIRGAVRPIPHREGGIVGRAEDNIRTRIPSDDGPIPDMARAASPQLGGARPPIRIFGGILWQRSRVVILAQLAFTVSDIMLLPPRDSLPVPHTLLLEPAPTHHLRAAARDPRLLGVVRRSAPPCSSVVGLRHGDIQMRRTDPPVHGRVDYAGSVPAIRCRGVRHGRPHWSCQFDIDSTTRLSIVRETRLARVRGVAVQRRQQQVRRVGHDADSLVPIIDAAEGIAARGSVGSTCIHEAAGGHSRAATRALRWKENAKSIQPAKRWNR